MIDGRSAILTLIACILLGAPSHGSRITDNPAYRAPSMRAGNSGSPAFGWYSSAPPRAGTLSHFTPWKTRIKSVLGETYERIIDEGDFGVAILPGQFDSLATLELVSFPVPIRSPLRC